MKFFFWFVRAPSASVEQQTGTALTQHKQTASFSLAGKQLRLSDELMKNKNITNISWRLLLGQEAEHNLSQSKLLIYWNRRQHTTGRKGC